MKAGQRIFPGLALALAAAGASAAEWGTAFSYQGRLEVESGPVTNTSPGYDFEFELWHALAAGAQINGAQAVGGVSVGIVPQGVAFDGANIRVANVGSDNVTKVRVSNGVEQPGSRSTWASTLPALPSMGPTSG